MLCATLALLCCPPTAGLRQEPSPPRLHIETRSYGEGKALAHCEVVVLEYGSWGAERLWESVRGASGFAQLLEEQGQHFRSDADGRLELPLPASTFMLGARSADGLTAFAGMVDPQDVSVLTLELHQDVKIRFQCLDARGDPVAGVPIALAPELPAPLAFQTAWTDAAGIAELSQLLLSLTFIGSEFPFNPQFVVDLPLPTESVIAFGDARLFSDPVTLRLPDLGSVRVTLPEDWKLPPGQTPWMALYARREGRACFAKLHEGQRVVEFPKVGLGLELRADFADRPHDAPEPPAFAGPTLAGQTVEIAFQSAEPPPAAAIVLALAPSGEPMASQSFDALFEFASSTRQYGEVLRLSSDEHGRLALPDFGEDPQTSSQFLHLVRAGADGPSRWQALLDLVELARDEGAAPYEVHFTESRVLVAGRVVDPQGRPVVGAELWLYSPGLVGRRGEPRVHASREKTAQDGSFAILGIDERWDLALSIEAPGYERQHKVRVVHGDENIEIVCRPSARVTGRVLFDAWIPPVDFRVELPAPGANYSEDLDRRGRFHLTKSSEGEFTALRVTSGSGLAVFLDLQGDALRAALESGATGELLLDLRGKIVPLSFTARFPAQADDPSVRIRRLDGRGETLAVYAEPQDVLYFAELPVDLRLTSRGYRTVELRAVAADFTCSFTPGPELRVVVEPPEWIPEGWELISWVDEAMYGQSWRRPLDASGTTTLRLSDPGDVPMRITMHAVGKMGGRDVDERILHVGEGTTEVRIVLDRERIREITGDSD